MNGEVRSKLEAARHDARERLDDTEKQIARAMGHDGRSWSSPIVLTHRQRWAMATAEIQLLDKLLGGES